jgi:acetyl-CoA acetyltransferase family protein
VHVPGRKGPPVVVSADEGPREDTSEEALAALPPVFRKGGTVTAGNSSSLNDGAAGMLVVSEGAVRSLGLRPLARIVSTGIAGVDPRTMGMGPVPASAMALKKAGLAIGRIDLVELNEAFAAQALAVIGEMKADPAIVNVNGGAIALGHPLGCSGARILTTLARELSRRKQRYGLATMCIGVGQGIAAVIENIHTEA